LETVGAEDDFGCDFVVGRQEGLNVDFLEGMRDGRREVGEADLGRAVTWLSIFTMPDVGKLPSEVGYENEEDISAIRWQHMMRKQVILSECMLQQLNYTVSMDTNGGSHASNMKSM
jgi:hypothetical protein